MSHQDTRNKIDIFISEREFFWISELRDHLGITSTDPSGNTEYSSMTYYLIILKKKGSIQCCDTNKSERQYWNVNFFK